MSDWLGIALHRYDTCSSTNDCARALAKEGAAHGTVVIAETQTQGRGRLGHHWHSPRGENLYMSFILRPNLAPAKVPPITLACGLGLFDTVHALGVDPTLKWPNDVLVDDHKLAGILTETSIKGGVIDSVIVGIGLNLNTTQWTDELSGHATSLRLLTDQSWSCDEVISAMLPHLQRWLDLFLTQGARCLSDPWMARSHLKGKTIQVRDGHAMICGTVQGLDEQGHLCVMDNQHVIHSLVNGDVLLKEI